MRVHAAALVAALSALLLAGGAALAQDRPIVAVFDLEAKGLELDPGMRDRLTDYLETLMAQRGYQVVPRAQIKGALLDKKKDSYKECYDQGCQIAIGQELVAEKTLSSQVLKLGSKCTLTLRLYDLRKSTTEAAGTASGKCGDDDVVASLDAAMGGMLRSTGAAAPPAPKPDELAPEPAAPEGGQRPETQEEFYRLANRLLEGGKPEAARKLFEEFLAKWPQGSYTDRVLYGIGESYFRAGDFKKAIIAFDRVLKEYPKGDKGADALLKIGCGFLELGMDQDAAAFFEDFIQRFPRHARIGEARQRLKDARARLKSPKADSGG